MLAGPGPALVRAFKAFLGVLFECRPECQRGLSVWSYGGGAHQGEVKASAKALGWEKAWQVL